MKSQTWSFSNTCQINWDKRFFVRFLYLFLNFELLSAWRVWLGSSKRPLQFALESHSFAYKCFNKLQLQLCFLGVFAYLWSGTCAKNFTVCGGLCIIQGGTQTYHFWIPFLKEITACMGYRNRSGWYLSGWALATLCLIFKLKVRPTIRCQVDSKPRFLRYQAKTGLQTRAEVRYLTDVSRFTNAIWCGFSARSNPNHKQKLG